MQTNRLTMRHERIAMLDLLRQRENRTPLHREAPWVRSFWERAAGRAAAPRRLRGGGAAC